MVQGGNRGSAVHRPFRCAGRSHRPPSRSVMTVRRPRSNCSRRIRLNPRHLIVLLRRRRRLRRPPTPGGVRTREVLGGPGADGCLGPADSGDRR